MVTRRRLLALLGAASVPFAGCSERERRTPGTEDPPGGFGTPLDDTATGVSASETVTETATETPTETETETETTPENETATNGTATNETDGTATATETPEGLDLREANVTAVDWRVMNGVHRFDVTLYHDDDGEEGYADWWQIETTDGTVLVRRDLLHSHGTREFTRSESVDLPDDVTCVVVRGHDQTHGFGGQAMVVNLETGETTPVRQGSNLDPDAADGIC
ncbi:hypothetical protein [Halopelagius longus]|uniref:Uncharacterized protein n=1 Tax=Halopelagius longus TaxID=1236180 RepID=A0A1H0ZA60_9EURY|nr:hypothetical protein [Halopelagius longus]RDI72906.1 hypothetical protein DWB78_14895 [Halopelagius longus]SDQ24313.1 hypothetical protein SAMN05216278_1105 [Halopelagius longus]